MNPENGFLNQKKDNFERTKSKEVKNAQRKEIIIHIGTHQNGQILQF